MSELPKTMKAVELRAYDGAPSSLVLVERPLPAPARGDVLVKVAATPINPSDLAFIKGRYGFKKPLPIVPGFEGSGRVVASGGGLARALVGRRVSMSAPDRGDGTWAEYLVTPASRCFPLRPKVDDETGACMLVNPLTAWALLDSARRGKHRAVAQTAAASVLGRMMLKLARRRKLPLVNVVRRKGQVELLRSLGAEHVLDSSAPDFDDELKRLCRDLGVTLAFDAVAGEMPGRLLRALPRGGQVTIYGALSEESCVIEPGPLIFGSRSFGGFWLSDWFRDARKVDQARAAVAVQTTLLDDLRSPIQARLPLARAAEALERYAANMTAGKILLVPALT